MKVLITTQTEITNGGVERWLEMVANGLAERGVKVVLALAHGPRLHDANRYLARYPSLKRHELFLAQNISGTGFERQRRLAKIIRQVDPDVLLPVLLEDSLEIARRLRAEGGWSGSLVYPVHENEIWAEWSVRCGLGVIEHVICSNKIMTEHLRAAFPSLEARCSHVRVGVPRASRQAPHWKGGRPTSIGFCGKIVRECKRAPDFAEFINALSRSGHSIEVLVAGDGPYREEFLRVLSASVGTESVRYLGLVDTSRLYQDFYPQLDLLVVTSETETGPMVAWEAMMHRVLLLTSDFMGRRFEG
ncbi:MAG: glycosyltransferase family 4 protein, partial [Xanthomonadales bacterium]|nr:glycosyltransferase family 4 protein [Xanthomonadales bacterium]